MECPACNSKCETRENPSHDDPHSFIALCTNEECDKAFLVEEIDRDTVEDE